MAVKVTIPSVLRKLTQDQSVVYAEGDTVMAVIESLERQYPGFKERLCDASGKIRRFVNVYLNNEDIRYLDGADTKVNEGDEIAIVPAIAGG